MDLSIESFHNIYTVFFIYVENVLHSSIQANGSINLLRAQAVNMSHCKTLFNQIQVHQIFCISSFYRITRWYFCVVSIANTHFNKEHQSVIKSWYDPAMMNCPVIVIGNHESNQFQAYLTNDEYVYNVLLKLKLHQMNRTIKTRTSRNLDNIQNEKNRKYSHPST